ncbi:MULTISPECIES: Spy/CpxP family protein refolding chaperone [Okeania]|uniref:Periplasmic heavy metal sensor n=1 Tax=Okeania hirsuta TaxID=1458930 RepID=A0A3N6NJW2_9CYAN|nr:MULTISPECIES: periplasmic heavy metal sensor [Okeania]NEP42483.1 periplasmic heavy metal sensor [Okeania sp. SIO2H7]NET13527.1 periplasmic heavy metal sensor [Okeania sp. SIO1H6]NEP71983.1 periplasmic heavy metal sensor [Okeania sp. SIO2G5]NEP95203.1 periplasmic heavy metal sensor [Okeania sp. SIO2F5]NEQ91136.1 periplasmic heavy metal sensor [Okeania sp. SIO2G4]
MSPALISAVLGLLVTPLTISSVIATPNYNNDAQIISQTTKVQESQSTEEGVFQQLNLTQEQTDKIVAIRQQHQQQIIQSLENLRDAQEELNQMIIATNTDNQLRQKHGEVLQLRKDLAELQFNTILKIREVLTPEQLQQWSKLMQQRRESLKNR